ncbi:hypothetical protein ACFVRR_07330 [Gottfriedia sp. NPDC057948]|uniref:hypothetical protein n=1 Tax=Gottfriedia sp. NPDC057948 TaxID=3346287 RepID=UPI0036DC3D4C
MIRYPQMPAPTVEAFSNDDGTDTGYIDVSWEPVEGVTKYQVILFNGSIHSYWDVPSEETSWTTKDKGMFPIIEQIENGQVNFRRDGKATDFSIDPTTLYKKANEVNSSSLNYSESLDYYVRVTAVFDDGASPISYSAITQIPLESLPQFSKDEIELIESELIENNISEDIIFNNIYQELLTLPEFQNYSNVPSTDGVKSKAAKIAAQQMLKTLKRIGQVSWDRSISTAINKLPITSNAKTLIKKYLKYQAVMSTLNIVIDFSGTIEDGLTSAFKKMGLSAALSGIAARDVVFVLI